MFGKYRKTASFSHSYFVLLALIEIRFHDILVSCDMELLKKNSSCCFLLTKCLNWYKFTTFSAILSLQNILT